MNSQLNPSRIVEIGFLGFMKSKTLLSAVELGLFTLLGEHGMSGSDIRHHLELHPRSLYDFLDTLVALGFLSREGTGTQAIYHNTPESRIYLNKDNPMYIGGMLEMANSRLYPFYGNLTEGLKTGEPQNELKSGQSNPFEILYTDEVRLEEFLNAMQGISIANFRALVDKVDFSPYQSFCDVGGSNGAFAAIVAQRYPHLRCSLVDLPPVEPVARRHIAAMGVERVEFFSGDFFQDDLPKADILSMSNILHDWDESEKKTLIKKAYTAVNDGGLFIAIENIIDNERRENVPGLLMSLLMLIETRGGFDYTGEQFDRWAREAGFVRTEIIPLAGPSSAALAFKKEG